MLRTMAEVGLPGAGERAGRQGNARWCGAGGAGGADGADGADSVEARVRGVRVESRLDKRRAGRQSGRWGSSGSGIGRQHAG
jgi:hypothetical protein